MAGPAQLAGSLGSRGVPQGGIGADAGAAERAVCGAEIATAYVDDHSTDKRAGGCGGAGHKNREKHSPAQPQYCFESCQLYTCTPVMYVNTPPLLPCPTQALIVFLSFLFYFLTISLLIIICPFDHNGQCENSKSSKCIAFQLQMQCLSRRCAGFILRHESNSLLTPSSIGF